MIFNYVFNSMSMKPKTFGGNLGLAKAVERVSTSLKVRELAAGQAKLSRKSLKQNPNQVTSKFNIFSQEKG